MSSNNNNQNIVNQARDFIHGAVQTEDERQRVEQGKKSAFDRAYDHFDNMNGTQPKRDSDPQQANTRLDNLLDGAVKASMDGVESARRVIYDATKSPEEEELEDKADMPVHEKAVDEMKNKAHVMADTVGKQAQETKEAAMSATDDAQVKAEQALDTTQIKFQEKRKAMDERFQKVLHNQEKSESKESEDSIDFEKTKEVVEEKLQNLLGERKEESTEPKEEEQKDSLIDEAMGKIGETTENITNTAGGVVDGTIDKIGEVKDGVTQVVGGAVDGTKEKIVETKDASEKMFSAAVQKMQGNHDDETGSETDKSDDGPTSDSSLHNDLVKAGEAALGIDPVEDVKASRSD